MSVSDGLAAISAYGILLIVNNQIIALIKNPPLSIPDSGYLRRSMLLFFLVFGGLNLAFAKIIFLVVSSEVFGEFVNYSGWILTPFVLPIILPQMYALLDIVSHFNLKPYLKLWINLSIALYLVSSALVLIAVSIPRIGMGYTFVIAGLALFIWIILRQSRFKGYKKQNRQNRMLLPDN